MHQIRIHCQFLGYPIVNDPIYSNPLWAEGPRSEAPSQAIVDSIVSSVLQHHIRNDASFVPRPADAAPEPWYDPLCSLCQVRYLDPEPEPMFLYLHALKYSGPGWAFETELPIWARM